MPELPEVETVCRGLAPMLVGHRFIKVKSSDKQLRQPLPPGLAKKITGKQVMEVSRRAKYIQIILADGTICIVHLGMSGKLLLHAKPQVRQKHDHVWMELDNGMELVFNDPRRFGLLAVSDIASVERHPLFAHLGIEPLSKAFTVSWLLAKCKGKKQSIKQMLMDASIVVGVGNIYASESLFRAGILPDRPAGGITKTEAGKLVNAVKEVLEAAIASGGSTLRDYVRSNGDVGYFQHHFSVYGKEGKPCEQCGTAIKRITQSGRSTFYCRKCQH